MGLICGLNLLESRQNYSNTGTILDISIEILIKAYNFVLMTKYCKTTSLALFLFCSPYNISGFKADGISYPETTFYFDVCMPFKLIVRILIGQFKMCQCSFCSYIRIVPLILPVLLIFN